ncbi:MAG: hypothetical protein RsTaC01_0591 [Candidatus Paraimprobicoccus trichonymphae]|uniref:Uncharacterized protein n=1 Tax=Candidatus Paraimprobicoccus trichonymphae TaxID=3033793 RepID=A0AA48IC21_9FIRM|nr:MAG: hypothetical protein RsTaC01_0591 [Candidatus Paraimprobicoccus trichonymphae]
MRIEEIFAPLSFGERNKILYGRIIDSESKIFKKLISLDIKCMMKRCEALDLSDKLFESVRSVDQEGKYRYRDCVNFNFNDYIQNEERKQELDDLWKEFHKIKSEMEALILKYFKIG